MGIFNDGMYTEKEVEKIKDIFFEAGWLFHEFEKTPTTEREKWFHLYKKDSFSKTEYEWLCRILNKQITEYDLICSFDYHNEYTNYDEIYVRRK